MTSIATLSPPRAGFALSWPAMLAALAFALTLALGPRDLADPDIYFHIVTGRWIVAHGAVPHADLFSYSMPGAPWVVHEWLAEVIMAAAYDWFGWHGLVCAAGLAVAGAMAVFSRAVLRLLAPAHALIASATAFLLLLPHLLARPHLFALPVLVLWVASLVAARDRHQAPPLAVALLMVPWVNLHASFLFGLGFAGLLGCEAVLTAASRAQRWTVVRDWAEFGAVALLASLITPNGFEAYLLPYRLLHMQHALAMLVEWRSPPLGGFQPLEVWLLLALLAGFTLRLKLPPTRLAILLLLTHMALAHWRYGELLGFSAPLLVMAPLAARLKALRPANATLRAGPDNASGRWHLASGLAAALLMSLAAAAYASTNLEPPAIYRPAAAIEAVRQQHIRGPVLNGYNFGGYLIFAGIPTFIDGRADMYGDRFVRRTNDAYDLKTDELPRLLDEYHVAWTLFPAQARTVTLLDHLPGWRRLYADDVAVVHVRTPTP